MTCRTKECGNVVDGDYAYCISCRSVPVTVRRVTVLSPHDKGNYRPKAVKAVPVRISAASTNPVDHTPVIAKTLGDDLEVLPQRLPTWLTRSAAMRDINAEAAVHRAIVETIPARSNPQPRQLPPSEGSGWFVGSSIKKTPKLPCRKCVRQNHCPHQ